MATPEEDDTAGATQSLRMLRTVYRTASTARQGPVNTTRRSGTVHSAALIDLEVLERFDRSVREIEGYTRTVAPDAGPKPADDTQVYQWMAAATPHLDGERARERDVMVYRQSLENAVAAGDESIIRRHPCGRCGCWGLFWQSGIRRAVCVNLRCTDEDGGPSEWTLWQLAEQHVASRSTVRRTAT